MAKHVIQIEHEGFPTTCGVEIIHKFHPAYSMGFTNDYPADEILKDLQQLKKDNHAGGLGKPKKIRTIGIAITIDNQKNAEKALKAFGATVVYTFDNMQTQRKNKLWQIPLL